MSHSYNLRGDYQGIRNAAAHMEFEIRTARAERAQRLQVRPDRAANPAPRPPMSRARTPVVPGSFTPLQKKTHFEEETPQPRASSHPPRDKSATPGLVKCFNCGEYGHISPDCSKPRKINHLDEDKPLMDRQDEPSDSEDNDEEYWEPELQISHISHSGNGRA